MTNGGSDRLDRIERILELMASETAQWRREHEKAIERLTATLVQTADQQSTHEFQIAQHKEEADARSRKLDEQLAEIHRAIAIDAENIRRLANIAGAHEQRISDLEDGKSS